MLKPSEDPDGVVHLFTKGWLPYTLRWRFRITEDRKQFAAEVVRNAR